MNLDSIIDRYSDQRQTYHCRDGFRVVYDPKLEKATYVFKDGQSLIVDHINASCVQYYVNINYWEPLNDQYFTGGSAADSN